MKKNTKKYPWKTILAYSFFGFLWILFSDQLLAYWIKDYDSYMSFQTYKGFLYVLITSVLLYFLIEFDYSKIIALSNELTSQQQFVLEIYNNSNLMILICDFEGYVLETNVFFNKLFGYSNEEINGKKWTRTIEYDMESKQVNDMLEILKANGRINNNENQFKTKSGNLIDIIWNATVIKNPKYNSETIVLFGIDVTSERQHERHILELSSNDRLTGLYNQQIFKEKIELLIKKEIPFTIYYLDLDDFKNLNEVHGHNYGNLFLVGYTNMLKTIFDNDYIFRWSGDEFTIIDFRNEESTILEVIRSVNDLTRQKWTIEYVEYFPSVSIGITKFPMDGDKMETLLKNMDMALHKAKSDGKSTYKFYNKDFQQEVENLINIESVIIDAIENNKFVLNYQPIYNLDTNKIIKIEALLRSTNPEIKMNIGDLIAISEEIGQIQFIDQWVLKNAFDYFEKNMRGVDVILSINLSAKTLGSTFIIDYLRTLIKIYEVDPCRIEFEITEHSLIHNFNQALDIIHALKKFGFKIALDDFGTRFSSLNYLSKIPFDTLKIDKSYVDKIIDKGNDYIIVEHVIQLAKKLNLNIVAEGIEFENQKYTLMDLGCTFGQGYYLNRPMSSDAMSEKINNQDKML